jgi:aspartate aminotransferase-like enzyme
MIKDETIEQVWKRTHLTAEAFRQGVKALGFELFSQQPADSVTAVRYPAGVSDKDFRGGLKTSTTSTSPVARARWRARSSASITWATATPTTR